MKLAKLTLSVSHYTSFVDDLVVLIIEYCAETIFNRSSRDGCQDWSLIQFDNFASFLVNHPRSPRQHFLLAECRQPTSWELDYTYNLWQDGAKNRDQNLLRLYYWPSKIIIWIEVDRSDECSIRNYLSSKNMTLFC
jgi:hypothetical protein